MMQITQPQFWKGTPFTIERKEGKAPGTVIFRFLGPFTARDMFGTLAPVVIENMLSFQPAPGDKPPALNILDLTGVPYMDSAGLGRIVRHYVHCRGKGIRMVAAGASPRVLELFKMTRMDSVIPMSSTVEQADDPVLGSCA
jgi:ABC-type transporter Mla MlaB component